MLREAADVQTVEIAFEIVGEGPWLTLLHGFSQDRRLWSAQDEPLAARYRLLLVDLRGHGESPPPESGYGPVEYSADLLALLDRLGIAATHIWGSHTGAGVGLLLAVEQPDRVGALVLEGAVIPGEVVPSVEEAQARARSITREQGVGAARTDWFDYAPFFERIRREPARRRRDEHRAMIERFSGAPWRSVVPSASVSDVVSRLTSVRHPTLLINGSDDLDDFHQTAGMLERNLPAARRFLIPGAGAFPAWEEPGAVNPVVMSFLDDVD